MAEVLKGLGKVKLRSVERYVGHWFKFCVSLRSSHTQERERHAGVGWKVTCHVKKNGKEGGGGGKWPRGFPCFYFVFTLPSLHVSPLHPLLKQQKRSSFIWLRGLRGNLEMRRTFWEWWSCFYCLQTLFAIQTCQSLNQENTYQLFILTVKVGVANSWHIDIGWRTVFSRLNAGFV